MWTSDVKGADAMQRDCRAETEVDVSRKAPTCLGASWSEERLLANDSRNGCFHQRGRDFCELAVCKCRCD